MEYDNKNYKTITVFSWGLDHKNNTFLQSYMKLIINLFDKKDITLVTNDINVLNIQKTPFLTLLEISDKNFHENSFTKLIQYICIQKNLLFLMPINDLNIFFLSQTFILQIIKLKLMRKKVFLVLGSSEKELYKFRKNKIRFFWKIIEIISFKLCDVIVVYSDNLISEWGLDSYKKKVKVGHRHYLDFKRFNCSKRYKDRDKTVGFIGRLSDEKGIINFIQAMPDILEKEADVQFLIIGNGILKSQVYDLLDKLNIKDHVKIIPEVEFEKIPLYLNSIKLLVLPSYMEGLPNVVIEAMACGTPVLANSVGAVPDIIFDRKTGFLLENNSPEVIAKEVVEILNHKDINKIIENSKIFVESEFDFVSVSKNYKKIFNII
ncbi:glycosyltransferase family 4 protein [Methanobacterium formicicum]|uniref:glycosyltransferase family 4 protein n=1 Tax=Methanobacterium formicicum TaxID=2162 RepID=UPI002412A613|nr:glycosyltransferase family 4 protein [Methanobacterium formicicum]MDG3547079.1 glycosyltransferase family 4 protein [Methanobacterium formicicum]